MSVNEWHVYVLKDPFKKQAVVSYSSYTLKKEPEMNIHVNNMCLKELQESSLTTLCRKWVERPLSVP